MYKLYVDKELQYYIVNFDLNGIKSCIYSIDFNNLPSIEFYIDEALVCENWGAVKIILREVSSKHKKDVLGYIRGTIFWEFEDDAIIKLCEICPEIIPKTRECCEQYKNYFKVYTYFLSKLDDDRRK